MNTVKDCSQGAKIRSEHPKFMGMAQELLLIMAECDAENFVCMTFKSEDAAFDVTIQKVDGQTPQERIADLTSTLRRLGCFLRGMKAKKWANGAEAKKIDLLLSYVQEGLLW